MKYQRQTLEEKKDLVGKVDELIKVEKISVKEACTRLDIPYWKYHAVLKSIKNEKKKARAKAKALTNPSNCELKVELVFNGDIANLIREHAEAYCIEPGIVCRIMVIDALKNKK